MGPSLLSKLTVFSTGDSLVFLPDIKSNSLIVSTDSWEPDYYYNVINILLTNSNIITRNPQVYTRIIYRERLDSSRLIQKHTKQLHLVCVGFYEGEFRGTLLVSRGFPHCPQFTHFTAERCDIDNSVPAAFMKAVQDGKFPKLRRIDLDRCFLNDCEWPEVPEFSLKTWENSDPSQIRKLVSKLTELTVHESVDLDRVITGRLKKLSVLKLRNPGRKRHPETGTFA